MSENAAFVAILSAILAFAAALFTAAQARRHDRYQQARVMLFAPADSFARATLAALAALRHVTPPRPTHHRNEFLIQDRITRKTRLEECITRLDAVREERAGIPLAFGPTSRTAEQGRRILGSLRRALESAEAFYAHTDESPGTPVWTLEESQQLRETYKWWRTQTYDQLTAFYGEVSAQMEKPTWSPHDLRVDRPISDENDTSWAVSHSDHV